MDQELQKHLDRHMDVLEKRILVRVDETLKRFPTWQNLLMLGISIVAIGFGVFQWHESGTHPGAATTESLSEVKTEIADEIAGMEDHVETNSEAIQDLTVAVTKLNATLEQALRTQQRQRE